MAFLRRFHEEAALVGSAGDAVGAAAAAAEDDLMTGRGALAAGGGALETAGRVTNDDTRSARNLSH